MRSLKVGCSRAMRLWSLCAANFLLSLPPGLPVRNVKIKFRPDAAHWPDRSVLGTGWIGLGENRRAVTEAGASDGGTLDGVARGLRFGSGGENARADFC